MGQGPTVAILPSVDEPSTMNGPLPDAQAPPRIKMPSMALPAFHNWGRPASSATRIVLDEPSLTSLRRVFLPETMIPFKLSAGGISPTATSSGETPRVAL